jgi:hypothetical protein
VALRAQVIDFVGLKLVNQVGYLAGVGQVSVVQVEPDIALMGSW